MSAVVPSPTHDCCCAHSSIASGWQLSTAENPQAVRLSYLEDRSKSCVVVIVAGGEKKRSGLTGISGSRVGPCKARSRHAVGVRGASWRYHTLVLLKHPLILVGLRRWLRQRRKAETFDVHGATPVVWYGNRGC